MDTIVSVWMVGTVSQNNQLFCVENNENDSWIYVTRRHTYYTKYHIIGCWFLGWKPPVYNNKKENAFFQLLFFYYIYSHCGWEYPFNTLRWRAYELFCFWFCGWCNWLTYPINAWEILVQIQYRNFAKILQ